MSIANVRADLPRCQRCGFQAHWLGDHLTEVHGITIKSYLVAFPGAATASRALAQELEGITSNAIQRRPPPNIRELSVNFAGSRCPVNWDVPASDCLSLPECYRVPQHGTLAEDCRDAVLPLVDGGGAYIYGLPGSGKDAFVHAFCALTRTPSEIFQVEPNVDMRAWFFSRSFDKDGTEWEEGKLLTMARDGYTTRTGRKIPYIILITDFDRATKAQAESLRLIVDTIGGRIKGPRGETYPVFPGTQIVCTANTMGAGDARGRCTSANVIDAAILDRLGPKFEFHMMDWRDEGIVCQEKFPLLVQRVPGVFPQVGAATAALRAAVAADELYAEFSHRALCEWLRQVDRIIRYTPGVAPTGILKRAARVVINGMPDAETRLEAERLIDPHIQGGAVDQGTTDHIGTTPLVKI